jgi:hypothetical protein
MSFGINQYWAPTPKKIRKVADSVVAATTFGGSITILNGYPTAGTIIFVLGVIAKFVSNLFSDDSQPTT